MLWRRLSQVAGLSDVSVRSLHGVWGVRCRGISGSFGQWRISGGVETLREQCQAAMWSVHVEAWRRSGLSRARYCRAHRLTEGTFVRWLKALEGADGARKAAELLREQRLLRRRRGPSPLCKSKRSIAVQAFLAMHVEAMTWSGMAASYLRDQPAALARPCRERRGRGRLARPSSSERPPENKQRR